MSRAIHAIALALTGHFTAAHAQIQPLDGIEIPLGGGYNFLTGATSQSCVTFESDTAEGRGQNTTFSLGRLESTRQLRTDTEMSASMSIGYGPFQAKGTASSAAARAINAYSTSVLLRVRVDNPAQIVTRAALTDEARQLLSNPTAFARRCGTHFASQRVAGGEFVAVLSISSSTDAEKSSTDASIAASYGTFAKGDARFSSSYEAIARNRGVRYEVHRRGSSDPVPPPQPAALQAYALEFPTRVATGSGGARGLYVILSEYSTIEAEAPSFAPQIHFLNQVADAQATLQDQINTLEFARSNPGQFPGIIASGLPAQIDALSRRQSAIRDVGIQCILEPANACRSTDFSLPAEKIPARPPWRRVNVNTRDPQLCAPAPANQRWVVAARGYYSPWREGQGPSDPWRQTLAVVTIDLSNRPMEAGITSGTAPFLVQRAEASQICVRITDSGSTIDNHHKRGSPLEVVIYPLPGDW